MDITKLFLKHNMRLTPEAEEYLRHLSEEKIKEIALSLIEKNKIFVSLDDVKPKKEKKVVVIRSSFKDVPAREYSSSFKIYEDKDITGKSRASGKFEDFVELIRDRFRRTSSILRNKITNYQTLTLKKINDSHMENEKVKVIVIVSNKRMTKKGNMLLDVEDETDTGRILILPSDQRLFNEANTITYDAIIGVEGTVYKGMVIADRIVWPDIPFNHKLKPIDEPMSIMYLSDTHIGSKLFLDNIFQEVIDWLKKGEGIAGNIKYVCFAGDIVDGVGIYPKQENELVIKDIYEQYEIFRKYLEQFPDYIETFVIPGNHDAVRRAQPQPRIPKELINMNGNVHFLGDPAWIKIENFLHLLYHGDALDSVIASIPGLDYKQPERAMVEVVKRRHLSPIYGTNPIVPEKKDYLMIDEVPDIVNMGHLHRNGVTKYRDVYHICSGTFQLKTEYQAKFGHVPTPGVVTVFDMKSLNIKNVDFYEGG